MSTDSRIWTQQRVFPSEMATAHVLIQEVLDKIRKEGWSEKDIFAVELGLEEAFANAVSHGNEDDLNKKVHYLCYLTDKLVHVEIEDEGCGFCPDTLRDPRDPDNIQIPEGRGVLLIRGFMSRVSFNQKGNRIIMERDRT
ncbi:MAG: ATP-binding protein [Thermoguttaceae bacterium]